MYPVNGQPSFTQLVNARTQSKSRQDLGLELVGVDGIQITQDGVQTTIGLYTPLSATLSVSPNSAEMGQVITGVTLNWSYNKASVVSQSLNNSIGSLNAILRTYTHTPILINSNTTYTLSASDVSTSTTANATITYYHRRFWGVTTNSSLTESEIELGTTELSNSKSKNITYDCSGGKRFWFAYPTTFGLASVTVNGFPFSGWIGGATPQTISITNSFGYTENYYYYLVNNLQYGSTIPVSFT